MGDRLSRAAERDKVIQNEISQIKDVAIPELMHKLDRMSKHIEEMSDIISVTGGRLGEVSETASESSSDIMDIGVINSNISLLSSIDPDHMSGLIKEAYERDDLILSQVLDRLDEDHIDYIATYIRRRNRNERK